MSSKLSTQLLFLLLSIIPTQGCDSSNNYQPCCCFEAFTHSGLNYGDLSDAGIIFTRNFSPKGLCQSARSARAKTIQFARSVALPDIGSDFGRNAHSGNPYIRAFSSYDDPSLFYVRGYQFDYIFAHTAAVFVYIDEVVWHGVPLYNSECILSTSEWNYRKEIAEGDLELPGYFKFTGYRVISREEITQMRSCRFIECLASVEGEGPFCTKSGRYETKEFYCNAFVEYRNLGYKICEEGDACVPSPKFVCVDGMGAMSMTDACLLKESGRVHEISQCNGGCDERKCQVKNCLKSFEGRYCSFVNFCSARTGSLYADAHSFCEAEPDRDIFDKLRLNVDGLYNRGSLDNTEVKNQEMCCSLSVGFFCDFNNGYLLSQVSEGCSSSVLSEAQIANSLFLDSYDEQVCLVFEHCMKNSHYFDTICLVDGTFYNNKRDYCDDFVHNSDISDINLCTFQGACINKLSCMGEVEGILGGERRKDQTEEKIINTDSNSDCKGTNNLKSCLKKLKESKGKQPNLAFSW